MQKQHTPGPWQLDGAEIYGAPYGKPVQVFSGKPPVQAQDIVARIPYDDDGYSTMQPVHVANARLIAAAPDMLAALQRALPCVEYAADELGSEEDAACLEQVRAAIKKAKA